MRSFAWVVVVAACGDVKEKTVDARLVDTAPPVDMMTTVDAPPPRCNPSAPFGAATAVTELDSTGSDEGAWLTADEKTVYFSSTRTGTLGGYDIFMATRPDTSSPWTNITPVAGVNATGNQRFPMLTADGLTMIALIGTSPNYQIALATRSSPSGTFSALADAPTINGTTNDETGSLVPSAFYMATDRDGNYEIYRAPRSGTTFQTPVAISGTQINTTATESNAVATQDELTLFFSSNRSGGVGEYDVYVATRASVADGFGAPVNVQSVNTPLVEVPTWVSADGCFLYLISGPTGGYQIMVAKRGN